MDNQNQDIENPQTESITSPVRGQVAGQPPVVSSDNQPLNYSPSVTGNQMSVLYQKGQTRFSDLPAYLSFDGTHLALILASVQDSSATVFSITPDEVRKVRSARNFVGIYVGDKHYFMKPQGNFHDFVVWLNNILPPKQKFMKTLRIQNVLLIAFYIAKGK
jgi:hypothetical protein